MEKILHTRNLFQFGISNTFKADFLLPIISNVKAKAQTNWDDYDEVYHCSRLIHQVLRNHNMHLDFHFMKRDEEYLGTLLATSGEIDYTIFLKNFLALLPTPSF